jgi:cysteine desulfurase
LYKKEKVFMKPMVLGGGQELGMRSGTENVAAIVGFGAAIREIENQKGKNEKIRELRDGLIQRVLADIPQSKLTGSTEKRLSHNAHFRFPGIRGRDVVILLDQKGIAAATGSACSEKQQSASHVLLALGLSAKDALSAVRITLGRYTTKREVEYIGKNLRQAVAQLRKERI